MTIPIGNGYMYCLGIVKSEDVMKHFDSSMLPISPQSSEPVPPISSMEPRAVQQNGSHATGASSTLKHNLSHLNLWTSTFPKMGCKLIHGVLVLVFLMLSLTCQNCDGSEALGFNIHHRLSDPVKAMFNDNDDQFPEKGTLDYYAAMVHRDRVLHRRRLAGETAHNTSLAFAVGNFTVRIDGLGFHLFWLPCDCEPDNCLTQLDEVSPDSVVDLNVYSLRTSSTGNQLTCTSPFCENSISCGSITTNTSSTGYLVEDVIHLSTNSNSSALLSPRIPFGLWGCSDWFFLDSCCSKRPAWTY
ncbi:Aspartyl protease family protein 1 [Bienertia sinuspersici]